MHLFDFIIVSASLTLSLTLTSPELRDVVSLLILLRLWRIVRLVDGLIMVSSYRHAKEVNDLKSQILTLELGLKRVKEETGWDDSNRIQKVI